MAKKSGGSKGAEKYNEASMPRVGGSDIRSAAQSLHGPRSYEKGGYPPQKGTLHINRDTTLNAKGKGED